MNWGIFLEAFHLLRPWVLVALLPVAWIWWQHRRKDTRAKPDVALIAPHLMEALTVKGDEDRRFRPIDLICLVLCLLVLGASGPTWNRIPEPFAAQTAPLVVVMQITPSMTETDIAPSRLERAKHKVTDLLQLRAGARTSLVAYAGTAHVVVPMTEDPGVMQPYLEGLLPEVMPRDGRDISAAFDLAQSMLEREDIPGGVLFLLDDLPAADKATLESVENIAAMAFLFLRPDTQSLPEVPTSATAFSVTPDNRDITQIEAALASAYARAQLADGTQPWQDRGAIFVWPAVFLLLFWFRRGFAVRWTAIVAFAMLSTPNSASAEGWIDWFLTPDQQGWRAFEAKEYARAADLFEDPYLRGVALYRSGQYEPAAEAMSRLDTAEAAFIEGMAHIKSQSYRDGVRGFERALDIDPDHAGAQQNLPVSRRIVEYVESTREQSDTGEEAGIGADDVVFDNEAARGADTEIAATSEDAPELLSTEQWMNTVDTRTGDFLRQRFLFETAGGSE
ncbi:Ca-activated chloride channel family protein [Shimia isoporae]|uniref:Ca-activated chloride channel family protein n=1 Tax=Shimia isoporae TaxID=647720 RepID=A0A4R1NAB6_9RHOB|nr:VWA domain-containing protein [Shimia isoporae]TCL00762.1 Ca-activated chloride channel family protein [Shimia isoporae]